MFYSSKYKPSAALLKDIDEYISGPLGFSNMVTCFKLLPRLYEKIATEYLDYGKLWCKKVSSDWESYTGFYAQGTGGDSPLVDVPTRGGVLVSWDREEVLRVTPAVFVNRFRTASIIYTRLKDDFPNLENKCQRLNLYKEIPSG